MDDVELHGAARQLDDRSVAGVFAQKGAGDRRRDAQPPRASVSLVRPDDAPDGFGPAATPSFLPCSILSGESAVRHRSDDRFELVPERVGAQTICCRAPLLPHKATSPSNPSAAPFVPPLLDFIGGGGGAGIGQMTGSNSFRNELEHKRSAERARGCRTNKTMAALSIIAVRRWPRRVQAIFRSTRGWFPPRSRAGSGPVPDRAQPCTCSRRVRCR